MAGAGRGKRAEVVTFKVDPSLAEAMKRVGNRSAFIRAAILGALESMCPLCQGTGVLTPNQKRHWDEFADDHRLEECRECNELRLVCPEPKGGRARKSSTRTAARKSCAPHRGRASRKGGGA